MPAERTSKGSRRTLIAIKAAHTLVWAFFVACILAVWVFAWRTDLIKATLLIGLVMIEVIVLAFNRWRCPLSPVAARYTDDRSANFDIYLPRWLAARTMPIFGGLYGAGIVFTLARVAFSAGQPIATR